MRLAGWLKRLWPDSRTIVLTAANLTFLLICALPAIYMFGSSFMSKDGGFTLASYSRIIAEPRQRGLLLTSATLGFGSAFLATVLGAPLGILLARGEYHRIVRVLLSIPLVIPPYVLALSWILLTGPGEVLARIVERNILSTYTYSPFAAALVLGVAFYPIVMLATEAAARRVNGRLEEAGLLVMPHAADTDNSLWQQPESPGLKATAEGFRHLGFKDDHEINAAEWVVYDALHAYCQEIARSDRTK
jgi:ABC-type Fe3+ transport system permease subunit